MTFNIKVYRNNTYMGIDKWNMGTKEKAFEYMYFTNSKTGSSDFNRFENRNLETEYAHWLTALPMDEKERLFYKMTYVL